jgi:hypothetical protein
VSPETKGHILAFSAQKLSEGMIIRELGRQNRVSKGIVSRLLKYHNNGAKHQRTNKSGKQRQPKIKKAAATKHIYTLNTEEREEIHQIRQSFYLS